MKTNKNKQTNMSNYEVVGYNFRNWTEAQVQAMIDESVYFGLHGYDKDGNEVLFKTWANGHCGLPEFRLFCELYLADYGGDGVLYDEFNDYAREVGITPLDCYGNDEINDDNED